MVLKIFAEFFVLSVIFFKFLLMGAGRIGPIVTQVSNGFSLIPPQEKSVSPRDK
jgi:hypothetical protein